MSQTVRPGALLEHERRLMQATVPVPEGPVHEDILVPARGFMRARRLPAGQTLRIVQVEGQQCADLVLIDAANMANRCSAVMTIVQAGRWKLRQGDGVYSGDGRRMVTIADETIAAYQVCGGCCSAAMNELRYGVEGTHSCLMNLVGSLGEYDFRPSDIGEGVFGVFFNMDYAADGSLAIKELEVGEMDYVDLRADMDLIVALSACPQERNPGNNWEPKALRVLIHGG